MVGMKPVWIFCVILLLIGVVPFVQASSDTPLLVYSSMHNLRLSLDPLTGSGYIEKEGAFISFAIGKPYVILDWKGIRKVSSPFMLGNEVMVSSDFIDVANSYFTQRTRPKKDSFSIATVLIDPGHGGRDPGAVSIVDGLMLQEKDLTLEVSKRVVELLSARYPDRNILTTRQKDVYPTLEERVAKANSIGLKQNEAVIYVSIHANASFNKNAKGYEVWFLNPEYRRTVVSDETVKEKGLDIAPILNAMLEEEFTTESIMLARKVYDRLGSAIGSQSPGRGIRAEEWFVVRNANMPSILIEMGFITHPDEGRLLANSGYLRRIGDAIYNGIVDFIEYFER
jgi:N-acetylmuramoyl-L-alanine amidase